MYDIHSCIDPSGPVANNSSYGLNRHTFLTACSPGHHLPVFKNNKQRIHH